MAEIAHIAAVGAGRALCCWRKTIFYQGLMRVDKGAKGWLVARS